MGRPDHRVQPLERRMYLAAEPPVILFIRGADRSGGFLEAGSDVQRTAMAHPLPGRHQGAVHGGDYLFDIY